MASPAAVGGSLLGAGAIGVGSAYLAGAFEGSGSLEVEAEPANVLLSEDSTFSTYTTDSWIGKTYGRYLVAPIGSKAVGDATANNEKWWKWSYERWQKDFKLKKDSLSDEFKDESKVGSAFSAESSSTTALNKVCEVVYKKDKNTITPADRTPDNKIKLKNDLFKYCSILGEMKTISEVGESNYNNSTKGKDETNAKKLVSVIGNDKFWEIRNEEFYANDNGAKSKSKATGGSSKFKAKSAETPRPKIRDICGEAYNSQTSDTSEYPSGEVDIFCVL
ncbi:hypothetical protein MHSWG343_00340 [Candidatus Mycoplasma haematohominis]|uniref:Uncharacterized protein n=1 Tax=Candidatus Mycoplasma haematohominis TaxID=1494318 RepID=A0A478FRS3_9MOLU|nr:hypothetical protein MHSWG343_00340 [Candidatus Mycoplasma haemohominis]